MKPGAVQSVVCARLEDKAATGLIGILKPEILLSRSIYSVSRQRRP